MASKDTAAVQVGDESWLFFTTEGRLLLKSSTATNEAEGNDYESRNIRYNNNEPIFTDLNSPIAAVAWDSKQDTHVRVYITNGGRLQELAWDKSEKKWYQGLLTKNPKYLANGTGLTAAVQQGQLKVFCISAGRPNEFTLYWAVLAEQLGAIAWAERQI